MHRLGRWLHSGLRPVVKLAFTFQKQPRTRVWLTNSHGQVLLVKTWFGTQKWSLPGGGIERGETPRMAIARELREETGIILSETEFIEYMQLRPREAPYDVIVFQAKVNSDKLPPLERGRNLEIIGRLWADPQHFPENTSNLVQDMGKTLMLADNA